AGADPLLRLHLPPVRRLLAWRGAPRHADERAGHPRVHPRTHRPGRGRPHAPAGQAPARRPADPARGVPAAATRHRDPAGPQRAAEAQKQPGAQGIATRPVSMPAMEWFDEQDEAYGESVLPSSVTARVSVEAGIAMPWHRYLGVHARGVSLEHYGASADANTLFKEYGFTPEAVIEAARESLAAAGA